MYGDKNGADGRNAKGGISRLSVSENYRSEFDA
jgi:hypothetical protein